MHAFNTIVSTFCNRSGAALRAKYWCRYQRSATTRVLSGKFCEVKWSCDFGMPFCEVNRYHVCTCCGTILANSDTLYCWTYSWILVGDDTVLKSYLCYKKPHSPLSNFCSLLNNAPLEIPWRLYLPVALLSLADTMPWAITSRRAVRLRSVKNTK